MYTDEDVNFAVEKGVFTQASVEEFRLLISQSKSTPSVDEENFRLLGGFNDIFIVIACLLLLFSSWWVLHPVSDYLGLTVFIVLSWLLSEFFVIKRKMALPAIVLLFTFMGGVLSLLLSFFSDLELNQMFIVAASVSAIAAYLHWLRFSVPVTVAVGAAAVVGILVSFGLSVLPDEKEGWLVFLFAGGLATFIYAMYWDSADTGRVTRKSDVAFWLHLLSAPLIIHPVFSGLGILEGNESVFSTLVIIGLYLLMTVTSIIIDRRALMVSSLVYVLYALSNLIEMYGGVGISFSLTGVLIGSMLLLLSAYWHLVRAKMVAKLPEYLSKHLPQVRAL